MKNSAVRSRRRGGPAAGRYWAERPRARIWPVNDPDGSIGASALAEVGCAGRVHRRQFRWRPAGDRDPRLRRLGDDGHRLRPVATPVDAGRQRHAGMVGGGGTGPGGVGLGEGSGGFGRGDGIGSGCGTGGTGSGGTGRRRGRRRHRRRVRRRPGRPRRGRAWAPARRPGRAARGSGGAGRAPAREAGAGATADAGEARARRAPASCRG